MDSNALIEVDVEKGATKFVAVVIFLVRTGC